MRIVPRDVRVNPGEERSAATDREWAGSWVRDANNIDLVNAVRKAVMISMSLTGSGTYTHDDYDDAMAALNELFRRAA